VVATISNAKGISHSYHGIDLNCIVLPPTLGETACAIAAEID